MRRAQSWMNASSLLTKCTRPLIAALLALALVSAASALGQISELRNRIAPLPDNRGGGRVALTLDACGGGFDAELIQIS